MSPNNFKTHLLKICLEDAPGSPQENISTSSEDELFGRPGRDSLQSKVLANDKKSSKIPYPTELT